MRLHNFASIVENKTVAQAQLVADLPFVYPHVALMPDAHFGKGSSVGTVFGTLRAVIPAAVGVDIGCGMIAVRTHLTRADIQDFALEDLRTAVEDSIPLSPGNYNGWIMDPRTEARTRELAQLAQDTGVDPQPFEALASAAGQLGRRQPLHRALPRRRRPRLAVPALRLARRG